VRILPRNQGADDQWVRVRAGLTLQASHNQVILPVQLRDAMVSVAAPVSHPSEAVPMKLAATLFLLALAACVSTNVALLDTTVHYAPVCKEGVVFYTTRDKAPQPFKEVAILSSSGSSSMTNQGQMIESMREKAAEIGATGVILNDINEPGAGAKVAGAIFGVSPERQGKALAIFAEADTARVRQACSPLRSRQAGDGSDSTSASTAAACSARDSVSVSPDGKMLSVTTHQEQAGKGCAAFRSCTYDAAVTTAPQALALCRGDVKKEE
jgi:hypothetical protein